ncbi:MAG: GNAT family N-acetyltransferase [Verrucomicrobiota bacterium]
MSTDAPLVLPSRLASPQVQCLDPLETPAWDAFLSTFPGATFFHTAAWARVLHETYRCRPLYFTAFRGDRLLALLPVMEMNSPLTGRRGVALPFSDFCEPLDAEGLVSTALVPAALEYGRQKRWNYFEARGGREFFPDALPFLTFFSHELKLCRDETYLFSRFASATRRAVRKVEKSGVAIEISRDLQAVENYYSLHCRTRRKHGLPPQPFAFFSSLQKQILARKNGVVVLARQAGRLVAGGIFFHFGDKAIYKFGASDPSLLELRGNNLVMWAAIKWYAGKGLKSLDFGRTSIGSEGLRRFKLGWGSDEKVVAYSRYDFRKRGFVSGTDHAHGWHNHVFRALPLSLSRLIGSVLYRHVG